MGGQGLGGWEMGVRGMKGRGLGGQALAYPERMES